MNRNRIWSLLAVMLVFVLSFTGCKGTDEFEVAQNYYVSSLKLASYEPSNIKKELSDYGMAALDSKIKYKVALYKVTYKTYFEGDTIVASGTICIPENAGKKDKFPILSYQHSTVLVKNDAPSVGYENFDNKFLNYVASMGYIVAIPDYIGFGSTSNEFHPFLNKQYTNSAIIDFIRAAKEFVGIEKISETNGKIFMAGYSQGASATLGALSAIENNALNDDIKITGAACGGGAYDLVSMEATVLAQSRYEQPYFMAYVLESFKTYDNLTLDYADVFNERYASKIPGIIDGIKTTTEINAELSEVVEELFTENYRLNNATDSIYTQLNTLLSENSIEAWKNTASIRLFHGMQDVWIKGDQSIQMEKAFTAAGSTDIEYTPLVGTHMIAAPLMFIEMLDWFPTL